MTEVVTEVRAQRQLDMERLSGQIEVNVALVHKLTQYVAQAERVRSARTEGGGDRKGRDGEGYVRGCRLRED